MARMESRPLDTGDLFPDMGIDSVDGGKILLPRDFGKKWHILLFYSGHW